MTATADAHSKRGALLVSRADLLDVAFAVALVALGVIGFRSSFAGHEELYVGLPSVALGGFVGMGLAKWRPPLLLGAAVAVGCFFALAGVAGVRDHAIAGLLPAPPVWQDLVDGTINGWQRLLTTVPPAGKAGNLLAIPYATGYFTGLLAVVLALLVRRWSLCLLPAIAALAISVLFGVHRPASLLLQGALFTVVLIAWLAVRGDRMQQVVAGRQRPSRLAGSAALLAVAALGGFVVGPKLPFTNADRRYVLRDEVQPPFDPSQFPSPLAAFRRFDGQNPLPDPLFTVEGLPDGEPVRFAVMDAYDGYVWRASPPTAASAGSYQRVGPSIPDAPAGPTSTVRFTMGALAQLRAPWVPTAGAPTSISYTGNNADRLNADIRFNRKTESAASPVILEAGDSWTVTSTFPQARSAAELASVPADPSVVVTKPIGLSDDVVRLATEWTKDATSPMGKVQKIQERLMSVGAYNNGDPQRPIAAGHSLARLIGFITADQPEGNGEQYAAATAYLAEAIGVPARVVLEFVPRGGTGPVEVRAKDVRATVEVALQGAGWVSTGANTATNPPKPQTEKKQETPKDVVQPPPPPTSAPPNSLPDNPNPVEKQRNTDRTGRDGGSGLLGTLVHLAALGSVPAAVLLGPPLLIVGLKARRRKRRRTLGVPATRVAGAWAEVADLARDHGTPVPPKATRKEVSRFIPAVREVGLAEQIDAIVFGPSDPTDADALAAWEKAMEVRAAVLADKSRLERLRVAVSLTSLR